MSKLVAKQIEVYADWVGLEKPSRLGLLIATPSRGKEIFSFEYDATWLKKNKAPLLDPSLQLFQGVQYAPSQQSNFGLFLDSSPDRWGRVLMDRREAQLAREENRIEKKLLESDYLLGVYDLHRLGGLRFRLSHQDFFLDNNEKYAAPPWTLLRKLEHASLSIEKDNAEKNRHYSEWLKLLIAPGASLGGARPKASVMDEKKHLWIAKFPSLNDLIDIGAWEILAYKLAKKLAIDMADAKIKKFNSPHHTFLSKRFDRNNKGQRIHFASAMTLLQRSDGDDATEGVSYLELAEFIIQHGAKPLEDLEQLWRRIVFFICISNVDDHLRNHGFLLTDAGWILSPAYDINPVAMGNGLKLNISESDNAQDLKLAKDVSKYFRIKPTKAHRIIQDTIKTVNTWHKEAKLLGIPMKQQDHMASAFRVGNES